MNERGVRGWKKIDLWIEQEEAEQIVLSDDEVSAQAARHPVRVKVEDEPMSGVVVPELETMVIEDEDTKEEKIKRAREIRARSQKRRLKGKTREEKEEMAREEIDTEVLRDQFLGSDPSEVLLLRNTPDNS